MIKLTSTYAAGKMHRKIAALTILCSALGALSAHAATPDVTASDDVAHLVVRYHADNLTTDQGVRVLYRQLKKAAEEVCPSSTADGHFISPAVQDCRNQSIARAVRQIGNPRLAAVSAAGPKIG